MKSEYLTKKLLGFESDKETTVLFTSFIEVKK